MDLPVFLQQQLKAREGAIVEIPASWPGYALRGRIAAPGERSTAWEIPADGPFSQEQLDALAEPYRYTPEAGRQAGTHRGAHFFTIGQRKGLGVGGYAEPLFVIASDVEHNVLYVGMGQEHPGLYRRALRILPEEMHWIRPDRALQPGGSARFSMRIRYRQPLQGGVLHVTEQGGYIVFDRPQRGVTAGQFAAWYDGDELVGSGVIHRKRTASRHAKAARSNTGRDAEIPVPHTAARKRHMERGCPPAKHRTRYRNRTKRKRVQAHENTTYGNREPRRMRRDSEKPPCNGGRKIYPGVIPLPKSPSAGRGRVLPVRCPG